MRTVTLVLFGFVSLRFGRPSPHTMSITAAIPSSSPAGRSSRVPSPLPPLLSSYLALHAPRLSPDVSRILFVKALPFDMSEEDLFALFGQYGGLRQVRLGVQGDARGKAFIVFGSVLDARAALEALNGFYVKGRYIVVLYHKTHKLQKSSAVPVKSSTSSSSSLLDSAGGPAKKQKVQL